MDQASLKPLVLDYGSGFCKTGFAGHDSPTLIYPSCIQRYPYLPDGPRRPSYPMSVGDMDCGHGDYVFPIEHGMVTNWDMVEHLWDLSFTGLTPKDHTLLITESPLTPKSNRENIAETMFEKYKVAALYFANTAKMCSYKEGVETGLILELGDGVSSAVPIVDGVVQTDCIERSDFGGKEITKFLTKLLDSSSFNSWEGLSGQERFSKKDGMREVVRRIKERACYVAMNLSYETKRFTATDTHNIAFRKNNEKTIKVKITKEKFICPEGLFDPVLLTLSSKGILELIVDALQKCDPDIRRKLRQNIVLCGGTAQLPGLPERLLIDLGEPIVKIRRTEDMCCAWRGASAFASNPIFRQMCTNKEKFEEFGAEYLHEMTEKESCIQEKTFQFASQS